MPRPSAPKLKGVHGIASALFAKGNSTLLSVTYALWLALSFPSGTLQTRYKPDRTLVKP